MLPWQHLDKVKLMDGHELRLMQRGTEFAIMLGTNPMMNSRLSGSEEALATLTAERLKAVARPRILIGGLGMGFTLRAALAAYPAGAEIIVSELVPAVIAWAKGPMADVFQGCLEDPRVKVVAEDVAQRIRTDASRFDVILLDVDNGPDGLTQTANDWLYTAGGLGAAKAALRPGGVLAVWSAAPDEAFTKRLRRAGFATEELRVHASRSKRGAKHTIWLGKR
jgi:spermidine synthase